jgi:hypothetical protein
MRLLIAAALLAVASATTSLPSACSYKDTLLVQRCFDDAADDICAGGAAFAECVVALKAAPACTSALLLQRTVRSVEAGCGITPSIRGGGDDGGAHRRQLQTQQCMAITECVTDIFSSIGVGDDDGMGTEFGYGCRPMLTVVNCFLQLPSICYSMYSSALRQAKVRKRCCAHVLIGCRSRVDRWPAPATPVHRRALYRLTWRRAWRCRRQTPRAAARCARS